MRQNPASGPDVDALRRHGLLLPVQGIRPQELRDSFAEGRAGHIHEAIDILAPRNTPVLAVEAGRLVKLFVSRQGGNTLYQFDPSETYAYYYAHLERYAPGVREGDLLRRGQVIGYVGTSGNAPPDTPHLHFAIFRLTGEKQWWHGTAIDPFPVLANP
jgi:murein DD-endopeptidase MepM/ murein hydrolase activator NlpD